MRNQALWTFILGALLGILIALLFYSIHLDLERFNESIVVEPGIFPQVSRDDLGRAHHYHGINYSYQDPSGTWYFNRAGHRCRLLAYLN